MAILPQTGQRLTALLDRFCPITSETRFTITPQGIAQLPAAETGWQDDERVFLTQAGYAVLDSASGADTTSTNNAPSQDRSTRQ